MMAETAVCQDVSKWECGICYEILIDPIVGNCGHDFCRGCLDRWRAHQGRDLRCPVCRGVFSDTGDRLGVCVRLREVVESLFPAKVAARRAELEQQAAASKKRSVERVQQEDLPQPATLVELRGGRGGRRRLHARRHPIASQHTQAGVTMPAAAETSAAGSTAVSTGPTLLAMGPAAAGQLMVNVSANASSPLSLPQLPQLLQQAQLQLQAAMAQAASQLEQLGSNQAAGSASAGMTVGQLGTPTSNGRWPILDVHFTMGWYERGCARGSGRRSRAGRRGVRA